MSVQSHTSQEDKKTGNVRGVVRIWEESGRSCPSSKIPERGRGWEILLHTAVKEIFHPVKLRRKDLHISGSYAM